MLRAVLVLSIVFLSFFALAKEIVVRPGDTLWALAKRHQTTVDALLKTNGLISENLRPGQVLQLPDGAASAPEIYTVKSGDTLYDIATAFNMTVDDLIAYNNLDGTVIRPGQTLALTLGSNPNPRTYIVKSGDTLSEIAKAFSMTVDDLMMVNGLRGSLIRPGQVLKVGNSTPTLRALVVTIQPGDTLWDLAQEYDTTPAAISSANGLAVNAVIHPGDTLAIPGRFAGTGADLGGSVATTVTVVPGDSLWKIARRYNTTVAALMATNNLSSDRLVAGQLLRVLAGSELVRARAQDPVPTNSNVMVWPLNGPITSKFGYRQLRIGGSNWHTGLDIDGVTGDPIRAATSGTVEFVGRRGGYGKLVIVKNGNTEYYYGHTSAILVNSGEGVTAGQVIARVGNTGRSTGSHLHFEIRVNGKPIDPLPVLESRASR